MAHFEQQIFINAMRIVFTDYFVNKKVLEIGSLNINGSVRGFFSNCGYVGVDLGYGEGVDIVCDGADLKFPTNTFDTVVSTECFEHNPRWVETFANMIRMCKSNGLVIMTCATEGRAPHGTTSDRPEDSPLTVQNGWGEYYENLSEQNFREHFNIDVIFESYQFYVNHSFHDLYFWGIKK